MPELPELEVIKQRLKPMITGKKVREFRILKPYLLKNYFSGDLRGEYVEDIVRRGKYLVFKLGCHNIYVHLMLHGSIDHLLPSAKVRKSATALLILDDGAKLEFSERTAKKRMSIYIRSKDEAMERIEELGVEPLSEGFTVDCLARILKSERKQLKRLLCWQSKIAGIGNAYADEILWRAGLSPFLISTNLTTHEVERLHQAVVEVLNWAIEKVGRERLMEKRDFLQIHGKKGCLCPKCGDIIRTVSFAQSDTFYCPTCQTHGHELKDRRMSKFYR